MKASDTVMGDEQIWEVTNYEPVSYQPLTIQDGRRVAKTQAKITWKAREPEIEQAHKAGIKEVVEWIEKTFSGDITKIQMMATNTWQAKLKEWEASSQ